MNKSLVTNLLALLAMAVGWFAALPWLWTMGLFAFSGAVTNWLAVHMLFEKVPLLYGSGVIPARFTELKQALHRLVMEQFFSVDNSTTTGAWQRHCANQTAVGTCAGKYRFKPGLSCFAGDGAKIVARRYVGDVWRRPDVVTVTTTFYR